MKLKKNSLIFEKMISNLADRLKIIHNYACVHLLLFKMNFMYKAYFPTSLTYILYHKNNEMSTKVCRSILLPLNVLWTK